jgi:hypothetical protein
MLVDGSEVTSLHGVPVAYAGPVGEAQSFRVHGALRLRNGAGGINGTTDVLRAVGSDPVNIVVGSDFTAEDQTVITVSPTVGFLIPSRVQDETIPESRSEAKTAEGKSKP